MTPYCEQICPSCHSEISYEEAVTECKKCGCDLHPVTIRWRPGKYAYPDYPEFKGCK